MRDLRHSRLQVAYHRHTDIYLSCVYGVSHAWHEGESDGLRKLHVHIFCAAHICAPIGGETVYILETGFTAIGNLVQNFMGCPPIRMPSGSHHFHRTGPYFYWAYWMVWCVASPFFMGSISRGRTVRQVVHRSLCLRTQLHLHIPSSYWAITPWGLRCMESWMSWDSMPANGDLYETIITILHTLPMPEIVMVVLVLVHGGLLRYLLSTPLHWWLQTIPTGR